MAGDFAITATFRQTDIDKLVHAGLTVTVFVDLSHNVNFQTIEHPSNLHVIAKPIELDVTIGHGTATATTWQALNGEPTRSVAYQVYQGVRNLNPGGFERLQHQNVKFEAPNFDTTIVNFHPAPPASLAAPYAAATAATTAAFNNLQANIRKVMGMYQRTDATHFALSGAESAQPRTA